MRRRWSSASERLLSVSRSPSGGGGTQAARVALNGTKQDDFEWRLDTEEGRKIMSWEIEAQHRLEKIRNSNIDGEDQREE